MTDHHVALPATITVGSAVTSWAASALPVVQVIAGIIASVVGVVTLIRFGFWLYDRFSKP